MYIQLSCSYCHQSSQQEIVCIIQRATFLPYFLREFCAQRRGSIVKYHAPRPELFERHMRMFSKMYSFIDIESLADALEKKDFGNLPPKPLLITLDDGHEGNARLFNIMKNYNLPAFIFRVAGVVNTYHHFWFKTIGSNRSEGAELKKVRDGQRRLRLKEHFGREDRREYETR